MKKKYTYLIIIFLIASSCVAFGRIAGNDFINYDDNEYITENYQIQSGINLQTIKWAFTTTYCSYWHPLTWLSHMLDWSMFGANASGHHLISLFLHVGSVIFLFLFLNKTTNNIWPSAFAATLFALHPLRVESVAWASERKDVLSMFFGMAALYAYAFYVELPKLSKYILCLLLFIFSLMSKPMMVTTPFILLLLDYWPLKRWQKRIMYHNKRFNPVGWLILEKIPFICLTIVVGILTIWAQNKVGTIASTETLPFLARTSNAILSYMAYMGKIFWPVNLAVFYPYEYFFSLWKVLISAIILIVITIAGLYYIKKIPFIFVGWFWYLGTLVPVIGLVQVGEQAMADRYTYMPSIGIAIMLSWGIPLLFKREDIRKKILFPVAMAFLAVLVIISWKQCGYWKNSITIFNHVLKVTNNNHIAHNNLGYTFLEKGETAKAIYHFDKAISINRNYIKAYYNRGNAYSKLGQYQRAIEDYNEAIRLNPDFADAYNNRGFINAKFGQYNLAIEDFNNAIRIMPSSADAYYNRGVIYAKFGQYERAMEDYNEAVRLKPDYYDALYNKGIIYGERGQYNLAIEDFDNVIRLKPDYADAYNNRGFTYSKLNQYKKAIEDYNKAISLRPDNVNFYMNRCVAYLKKGNYVLGCSDAQKACVLGNCATLESAKGIGFCR